MDGPVGAMFGVVVSAAQGDGVGGVGGSAVGPGEPPRCFRRLRLVSPGLDEAGSVTAAQIFDLDRGGFATKAEARKVVLARCHQS